jgi:hypothetical protein
VRNAFWAAGILAFFALLPNLTSLAEYELGWFRLGFELLPAGLVGVFFGAILAIHLSTISSHLNLGALYFTRDLYQRYLAPDASERRLVWVGRIATFALLLGSFFYGLMMEEITQWLIFALWLMMAGVWLPNILQVVWWRFNAAGYLSAWMANLGISWLVVWVLPAFGVIPQLPDYMQFWLLMLLGALVYVPATLMAPAEKMDHLVRYYVMVRPLGWWGPVRREALRRGLIPDEVPAAAAAGAPSRRRPLIQRTWTAASAQSWSREDWIAIVLSPIVFACILIGVTKLLLLQRSGLWMTLAAILGSGLLYWIIDPKLRAVSVQYEAQQAEYLRELEQNIHWTNGEAASAAIEDSAKGRRP